MKFPTRRHVRPLLRSMTLCCIVPLLMILALRAFWGWHADHRLADLCARMLADGSLPRPTDLPDPSTIRPADNAVNVFFNGMPADRRFPQISNYGNYLSPLTAAQHDAIVAASALPQPWIDAIDAAGRCLQIVWTRDVFDEDWESQHALLGLTNAARFLRGAALVAHGNHDDALALHDLRRILIMAHILECSPEIMDVVIGQSIRNHAILGIDEMEETLDLRDPACAAAARALLASLLDDQQVLAGLARAARWLPAFSLARYDRDAFRDKYNWRPFMTRPALVEAYARWLDAHAAVAATYAATNVHNYGQARNALSPLQNHGLLDSAIEISNPPFDVQDSFIMSAGRLVHGRAAGLALAARLYAARTGNLPPNPAVLVPDFLPEIPVDPWPSIPGPLKYRIDANDILIWSVGPNMLDDMAAAKSDDIPFGTAVTRAKIIAAMPSPVPATTRR